MIALAGGVIVADTGGRWQRRVHLDYAFAPGGSGYDEAMQALFALRAGTTLVTPKKAGHPNVRAFLTYLEGTASVTKPVGDLLIASHANDEGLMQIALADDTKGNTTFEEIERVDDTTIHVPDDLIGASMTIHIGGCRIGQAEPFMTFLKHAFGDQAGLTAPLHFHDVLPRPGQGIFEYVSYSFKYFWPTALADRAAVVDGFRGGLFTFVDGSDVPDAKWPDWVPRSLAVGHQKFDLYVDLGQTIGALTRLKVQRGFRHDLPKTVWTLPRIATDPGSDTARIEALRTGLPGDLRFDPGHPYPFYERFGYSSTDDFVDGFTWKCTHSAKESTLTCVGTRHDYTVSIPVTDPATGHLLYNFYPNAGSGLAAVTTLDESDATLFRTV